MIALLELSKRLVAWAILLFKVYLSEFLDNFSEMSLNYWIFNPLFTYFLEANLVKLSFIDFR